MGERTFAGATISVSTTAPANHDAAGFTAISDWEEFCVDAIPAIKRSYNSVEKQTTCPGVKKKRKGSSMYDDVSFNFDPSDNPDAHDILQAAFDSQTAEISVRVKFALRDGESTPDTAYNIAQVGGYAESNGGDQDAIDLKETILWLQKENVRVAATS